MGFVYEVVVGVEWGWSGVWGGVEDGGISMGLYGVVSMGLYHIPCCMWRIIYEIILKLSMACNRNTQDIIVEENYLTSLANGIADKSDYELAVDEFNTIANCQNRAIEQTLITKKNGYNQTLRCIQGQQEKVNFLTPLIKDKKFGSLQSVYSHTPNQCDQGGGSKAQLVATKAKSKGPQPSAERVVVKGRNRVVYVGPKGGRYIKRDGKFVRL